MKAATKAAWRPWLAFSFDYTERKKSVEDKKIKTRSSGKIQFLTMTQIPFFTPFKLKFNLPVGEEIGGFLVVALGVPVQQESFRETTCLWESDGVGSY